MSSDRWSSVRERTRGDGTKCYSVLYWIDGKQSSVPFDDHAAANVLCQSIKVHGAPRSLEMHGITPARRAKPPAPLTVRDWIRHHIDHLTGVEQYTLDVYERYLANDVGPFLGDIPLTQLHEEDIARWVKHLETAIRPKTNRVLAPKTIANLHGFLSGALAAAVPRHIPANPAAGRTLPRKTGDSDDASDDIRTLSRDEFDRLLTAGTVSYWRPLLEFMVSAGARWGEIAALKPSDVDQSAGTVRIRRAWKHSSKGYHLGPTKTKRSNRKINVAPRVLGQLDYDHEWLFVNTLRRPLRYHSFKTNIWNKAVINAKLDPRPTPHDLRHTCASWMLAAGVPLTTVSRHLGHENIQITADIYTDVDRTSFAAAADIMEKLLS